MNKNDRELLRLAAIAARLVLCDEWDAADEGILIGTGAGDLENWNPLADDGAALRLAVKLRMQITPATYGRDEFTAYAPELTGTYAEYWSSQQDDYAATRRAIVRAAAQFGKQANNQGNRSEPEG